MNGPVVILSAPADLRKPDSDVKLLLIGVVVGLVIGVGVTIFYFSLTLFFNVQAKAADIFNKNQTIAENGSDKAGGTASTAKERGARI